MTARISRRVLLGLLPVLLLATACEKRVASGLSIGDTAMLDQVAVTVDRIEFSDTAGGRLVVSTPQPGTRFLWVHVVAHNAGETPIDQAIKVELEYREERVGSVIGVFYGPEHPALEPVLRLFPGISADGWRLFEVPVTLALADVSVVFQLGIVGAKTAAWSLGPAGGAP